MILILGVLINVAFLTLLERKVLRYNQLRVGPNKPSFVGLAQPAADAIKLFSNKAIVIILIIWVIKFIPVLGLMLILLRWLVYPSFYFNLSIRFRVLFLLMLLRLRVYPVMLMGWRSRRKYAKLGAIRNVAQRISYEVSLALIILILIVVDLFLNFGELFDIKLCSLLILPGLLVIWLIARLRETNRTPFDFSEGERELVSGFNVEFSRYKFAMIFMAEYARIYFLSSLTVVLFFSFFLRLGFIFYIFFWLWARARFPRYRYDFLINLNWKRILPVVLIFLFWVNLILI